MITHHPLNHLVSDGVPILVHLLVSVPPLSFVPLLLYLIISHLPIVSALSIRLLPISRDATLSVRDSSASLLITMIAKWVREKVAHSAS